MILVKGLLFEPLPAAPTPINPIPPSAPHPQSQRLLSISNPHKSTTNIPPVPTSNHDARSITPPTTISFKPKKTMPLTQSLLRCSSYLPRKPLPLTTYTLSNPAISSFDSLPRQPKRRKLAIPPSVEYNASAGAPQSTTTTVAFPTDPTTPFKVSEDQLRSKIWSVLNMYRTRERLHWDHDRRVPF